MWGTKLNDCYSPKNNPSSSCKNADPTDDSLLIFKVTIPKSWTSATLAYYSWDDHYLPYDWAEIRIDGAVVAQACTGSTPSPVKWTLRSVDLSKYVGQTVTVAFHFMATSVMNYSGWYIDDLSVTGK